MRSARFTMQKIRFLLILILLCSARTASYSNGTIDTLRTDLPGLVEMLPRINRDLKICDFVKKENTLLNFQVAGLKTVASQETMRADRAELDAQREKRKRRRTHIVRTVVEVAVIVFILMI